MNRIGFLLMLRNLRRFKEYSILALLGFSLSLSLIFLAVFCILNEIRYDTFHKNYENIYRITSTLIYKSGANAGFARVMPWVGPYLADEFPEVESVARFQKPEERIIIVDDQQFKERKLAWVDSSFFNVFGFELLYGNGKEVFKELGSVVLTKESAIKYFNTADAVGKTIQIDKNTYTVTGIVENGNINSHFSFNLLANSYYLTRGWVESEAGTHRSMFVYTYVKFKDGFSQAGFTDKFTKFENRYLTASDLEETGLLDWRLQLQPITDIHIGSSMKRELEENLEASTIKLIFVVTLIIVLIAGLNYIILTTAIYSRRVKEVAIQKVHGARTRAIALQFVKESLTFVFISVLFSFVFLGIEIQLFGNLFYERPLDLALLYSPLFLAIITALALTIGIIGGLYPSMTFAAIHPMSIFRSKKVDAKSSFLLRLCTTQAIISILMIGFTYVVMKQLSFFNDKDYGFDKNNLIVIFSPPNWSGYESFRNELMLNPKISNVSQTLNYPGGFVEEGMTRAEGYDETFLMPAYDGCENFIETMGFSMVAGRTLNHNDDWSSVIINEAAVAKFGWNDSPLGRKIFTIEQRGVEHPYNVVGVVKDFHYYSAHEKVEPFRIHMRCNRMHDVLVRVEAGTDTDIVDEIQKAWQKVEPHVLFDYAYISDIYTKKYEREKKLVKIFTELSVIAMVIVAMGFYGISSITVDTRTKEIGIRKTLGATAFEIFTLVMSKFLLAILIATLIAVPFLYLIVNQWLSGFAYSMQLNSVVFFVPVLFILAIGLTACSYYVIKAARLNPARTLKYE